jgi:hypothetical protein
MDIVWGRKKLSDCVWKVEGAGLEDDQVGRRLREMVKDWEGE